MEFVTENKAYQLSSISKSFAENYETCHLKAWKKKRNNRDTENRYLQVGLAAHEMFANEIAKRIGQTYKVRKISDPAIKLEAKQIVERVNFDKLLNGAQIIGFEEKMEALLPNGITLIGIADLLLLVEDEYLGPYLQIIDFKTSYVVSKELDNEAIFYAYLAARHFGMNVTFTRFSGRTGDEWGQFFKYEEALLFEDMINDYAEKIKEVVESEEEPFPNAGAHCVNCPYLDECSAKELDDTKPRELLAKLAFHKANAKILEEKIKSLRIEKAEQIKTEEFVVDMRETKSKSIANKGLKKQDIILTLAKSGKLEEFVGNLDLKITEEVAAKLEKYGFNFKDRVTRKLEIKPVQQEASNE